MKIPILKKNLSNPLIEKYKNSIKLESKAIELIDQAKDEFYKELEIKFDKIVGNPPYVKFQDMDGELRDYLKINLLNILYK